MARVNLKEVEKNVELEVGDIVISREFGKRLIINNGKNYYGVDPEESLVCGVFSSLEEAKQLYCKSDYRIIKSKDILIKEL